MRTRRRLNNFTHSRCHSAFIFNSTCTLLSREVPVHVVLLSDLYPLIGTCTISGQPWTDDLSIFKNRSVNFVFHHVAYLLSITIHYVYMHKYWMFLSEYSIYTYVNRIEVIFFLWGTKRDINWISLKLLLLLYYWIGVNKLSHLSNKIMPLPRICYLNALCRYKYCPLLNTRWYRRSIFKS